MVSLRQCQHLDLRYSLCAHQLVGADDGCGDGDAASIGDAAATAVDICDVAGVVVGVGDAAGDGDGVAAVVC